MYNGGKGFNHDMKLFDTHCHLQSPRLFPHLEAIMQRATEAGVAGLMCCGISEADWPVLPDIARHFPQVRLSFGLHPWYIGKRSDHWLDTLKMHLVKTSSAVGEIGLDHILDKSTFADQESVFLAQLHLANELQRPVTFHCRRAWGRLIDLLDEKGWPAYGVVLHSYSGPNELITPLVRRGAFFSFSGAITFDRNLTGRETVKAVPSDRLLIETDAPDLSPSLNQDLATFKDVTGKPVNEPAHLRLVAQTVANLRGLPVEEVASITFQNATALFG
jgi:TatD DNase family protein